MINLLHLSDTHNLHRQLTNLPDADIVVHSGDFTMAGTENEVMDFVNWFCDLPYRYKIFIAGNHDACLYGANVLGLDKNCYYLCNSGINIAGVNFYGIPMFVEDVIIGNDRLHFQSIPPETDVLITHQPPMGILDFDGIHYGSADLWKEMTQISPKFHLFGHIHSAGGIKTLCNTTFSNAVLVNDNYQLMPDLKYSVFRVC